MTQTLAIECTTEACSVALFDDGQLYQTAVIATLPPSSSEEGLGVVSLPTRDVRPGRKTPPPTPSSEEEGAIGFDQRRLVLVAGDWRMLGRGHAEALVPMIAALPGRGRAARIVVGLGPGSFTGVRIGLAAARALALAWQVPVLGYPTLALVAAMARGLRGAQPVLVAMTGGHGEWFTQSFAADGAACAALASLPPADAARLTTDVVAGSQAEALVARRGTGDALALWPDARELALLSPDLLGSDLTPLYGRPPDARLPRATLAGGGQVVACP